MCNCQTIPANTSAASEPATGSAPYFAPWQLAQMDAAAKDEQLKRTTMILQSMAALVAITVTLIMFFRRQ